jgi:hypothetical protein
MVITHNRAREGEINKFWYSVINVRPNFIKVDAFGVACISDSGVKCPVKKSYLWMEERNC